MRFQGSNPNAIHDPRSAGPLAECGPMKDFSNAAFAPETIKTMTTALEASVAALPEPVSSHVVHRLAETILRETKDGEHNPSVLQRLALLELQIGSGD